MRVQKRNPLGTGLGVLLVVITLLAVRPAGAQLAPPDDLGSDQAGSIVVFPKVIADGTRDTLITLTNTKNIQAFLHCEYVLGTGLCESSTDENPIFCTPLTENGGSADCPFAGERCIVSWDTQDFDLLLTRQQPTIWRVSTGRVFDPAQDLTPGDSCTTFMDGGIDRQRCPGYFITAGSLDNFSASGNLIPPPGSPLFRGELKCYQTDGFSFPQGGVPDPAGMICGNAIKGEAIIGWDPGHPVGGPFISKYNSINFKGGAACDGDAELRLDGVEYSACPEALEFTHFGNFADNQTVEALAPAACATTGCPVRTEITLMPCTELFEQEVGTRVTFQSQSFDEFETVLNSAPRTLDCWANYRLEDLSSFNSNSPGVGDFWKTRIGGMGTRCRAGSSVACGTGVQAAPCINRACDTDADCGDGGVCGPASGLLGIVEQFYYTDFTIPAEVEDIQFESGFAPGSAAASATFINFSTDPDADVFRRGSCRGDLGTKCTMDSECDSNECLVDVIEAGAIPGTEGPLPCVDAATDCPANHSCTNGFCQPIP